MARYYKSENHQVELIPPDELAELREELVNSIQIMEDSINDAIEDNSNYITLEMVDALDVENAMKRILEYE